MAQIGETTQNSSSCNSDSRKFQRLHSFKCSREIRYNSIYGQLKAEFICFKCKREEESGEGRERREGKYLHVNRRRRLIEFFCALLRVKQQRIPQEVKIDLTFKAFIMNYP